MANGIDFRQTIAAPQTSVRQVTQMVISPLSVGPQFQEISQTGSIAEFLFEMRKDGVVYWIGAAVPQGNVQLLRRSGLFPSDCRSGGRRPRGGVLAGRTAPSAARLGDDATGELPQCPHLPRPGRARADRLDDVLHGVDGQRDHVASGCLWLPL